MDKVQDAPYDVLLGEYQVTEGETHAVAEQSHLRGNLTLAQVLSHFPSGQHYDLIKQNCHHAARAAFEWAAPGARVLENPNPMYMQMLHIGNTLPGFGGFVDGVKATVEKTHSILNSGDSVQQ